MPKTALEHTLIVAYIFFFEGRGDCVPNKYSKFTIFLSKSMKQKQRTLFFVKKIIQNGISSGKLAILRFLIKHHVIGYIEKCYVFLQQTQKY